LCTPLWTRIPAYLPIFPSLYVTRFVIFLLMLLTVALWLLFGLPGLRSFARERWRALWAIAMILLAIWGFASTEWAFIGSMYPEVGETAALQLGVMVLFVVVVACASPPPHAIIAALVIGLIATSLITFGQAAKQAALGLIVLGELPYSDWETGMSFVRAGNLEYLRPYGLMPHPNMLAGVLVIGLLATASWILSEQRWQRYVGAVLFAIGLYALLLTFSRAGWGALVVGVFVALLLIRKDLRRPEARNALRFAVGLSLAAGVIFFANYRPLLAARVGEGQESIELRSVSDRIVFTEFALKSIAQRPLLGVGIGNFPWRTSYFLAETFYDMRGDNVHNIYLSAWAEMGTIGFVLYLGLFGLGIIGFLFPSRMRPLVQELDEIAAGIESSKKERVSRFSDPSRLALFAIFAALAAVGMLDHYPYTAIQFQTALWGCLAVVLSGN
jgi:O-antigen ligase